MTEEEFTLCVYSRSDVFTTLDVPLTSVHHADVTYGGKNTDNSMQFIEKMLFRNVKNLFKENLVNSCRVYWQTDYLLRKREEETSVESYSYCKSYSFCINTNYIFILLTYQILTLMVRPTAKLRITFEMSPT